MDYLCLNIKAIEKQFNFLSKRFNFEPIHIFMRAYEVRARNHEVMHQQEKVQMTERILETIKDQGLANLRLIDVQAIAFHYGTKRLNIFHSSSWCAELNVTSEDLEEIVLLRDRMFSTDGKVQNELYWELGKELHLNPIEDVSNYGMIGAYRFSVHNRRVVNLIDSLKTEELGLLILKMKSGVEGVTYQVSLSTLNFLVRKILIAADEIIAGANIVEEINDFLSEYPPLGAQLLTDELLLPNDLNGDFQAALYDLEEIDMDDIGQFAASLIAVTKAAMRVIFEREFTDGINYPNRI